VYVFWFTLGLVICVSLGKYLTRPRNMRSTPDRQAFAGGPTDVLLLAGPSNGRGVVSSSVPAIGDVLPTSMWRFPGDEPPRGHYIVTEVDADSRRAQASWEARSNSAPG
jgi:hypothetical protein